MTHPLYPYDSIKLMAIFVYGDDFTRQMNIVFIPEAIRTLAICLISFLGSATVILLCMRRKLRLRRSGLISVFMDIIIAFIAGGNLQMRHRVERWFFGILLTATFFITSLFVGELLDCVYRVMNQRISTFGQLAEIHSPVYSGSSLAMYEGNIHDMLRFFALNHFIFEIYIDVVSTLCRIAIGQNMIYGGRKSIRKLGAEHRDSFICVEEHKHLMQVLSIFMEYKRDFDVLDESLGNIMNR